MFRLKPAPSDEHLAIRSPEGWVDTYTPQLSSRHHFWEKSEVDSYLAGNVAWHGIAYRIHNLFHTAGRELTTSFRLLGLDLFSEEYTHTRQRIRRMSLGALGLSELILSEGALLAGISPRQHIGIGSAQSPADILIDDYSDPTGMPHDYGLHLPQSTMNDIFESTATDCWFRDGSLWVYRTTTANPSLALIADMLQQEVTTDFKQMATAYPYMATQQSRIAGY